MASNDPLLKTQQVAEALGVSVSTIKRWVDNGTLPAIRTVGGHRLIPLSEARSLAGRQGLMANRLDQMAEAGGLIHSIGLDDRSLETLVQAITQGDSRRARDILHNVYATGLDAVSLGDTVIRPLMERIVHHWADGSMDVYQEHQATQVINAVLSELIERSARTQDGPRPLALGATPEGDPYTLSLLLGELVLREAGWDVRNLGPNLPLRSLGLATLEYQPRLIFLSVSHLNDVSRFVSDYRAFYKAAATVEAAVMIGGRAFGPDLRAQLVYASHGERMAHLSEFARRIAPVTGGRARHKQAQDGSADSRNG